jgi:hypothetical protein
MAMHAARLEAIFAVGGGAKQADGWARGSESEKMKVMVPGTLPRRRHRHRDQ